MAKRTRPKAQKFIYKTLHRKLKIEQHKLCFKRAATVRCSGRGGNTCSKYGKHCVTLITYPVMNHEWRNDWIVTQICRKCETSHGGDRRPFKVIDSYLPT